MHLRKRYRNSQKTRRARAGFGGVEIQSGSASETKNPGMMIIAAEALFSHDVMGRPFTFLGR